MKNINTADVLKSLESSYLNKKFDDGINLLLKHKDDLDVGFFHFYFGSFHLKKGDFAVARYHLEKAIDSGHFDPGLFHNVEVAKSNLPSVSVESSQVPFDKVLNYSKTIGSEYFLMFALVFTLVFVNNLYFLLSINISPEFGS